MGQPQAFAMIFAWALPRALHWGSCVREWICCSTDAKKKRGEKGQRAGKQSRAHACLTDTINTDNTTHSPNTSQLLARTLRVIPESEKQWAVNRSIHQWLDRQRVFFTLQFIFPAWCQHCNTVSSVSTGLSNEAAHLWQQARDPPWDRRTLRRSLRLLAPSQLLRVMLNTSAC